MDQATGQIWKGRGKICKLWEINVKDKEMESVCPISILKKIPNREQRETKNQKRKNNKSKIRLFPKSEKLCIEIEKAWMNLRGLNEMLEPQR